MNTKYKKIINWVKPLSRVLDLGCGDGELLSLLQQHKQTIGYGIEIHQQKTINCIANKVNVIAYDLNDGLDSFDTNSFDYALLTATLQAVQSPDKLLNDMLRVANEAIVTFPNFSYWQHLYHLCIKKRMPVSKSIPYMWFNSPNIHLCTLKDFEDLCRDKNFSILNRDVMDNAGHTSWYAKLLPHIFAQTAVYRICKNPNFQSK